jgi:sensor histidine kinase YesM
MIIPTIKLSVISILLATLLIICVVAIAILYIKYKAIKRRNLQIEQQLLLSQMNPHFVFNSLTAIQSYIFRNEAHLASKYLASFAKLIRLILENSRVELNTLEREVTTLKHYLELQALRFEGRFDYKIEVDDQIDIDNIQIPPMLAQPFIENAIEHGFIHSSEKGMLFIRFLSKGENCLTIEVEDNGIGIEKSRQIQMERGKNHRSLATEITQERIRKIRNSKGLNIEMSIIDIGTIDITRHGTLVKFNIPLNYAECCCN